MLDDCRHGACVLTGSSSLLTFAEAVRLGYLLGLEQLSMHPDDMEEGSVDDPARGKVVWACEWAP